MNSLESSSSDIENKVSAPFFIAVAAAAGNHLGNLSAFHIRIPSNSHTIVSQAEMCQLFIVTIKDSLRWVVSPTICTADTIFYPSKYILTSVPPAFYPVAVRVIGR